MVSHSEPSDTDMDAVEVALSVSNSCIRVVDLETETVTLRVGDLRKILNIRMDEEDSIITFLTKMIHPDDIASVESTYRKLLNGETEQSRLAFRTHPDSGEVRWIETYASINHTEQGRQIITHATDITERKHHEQELAAQKERLEQVANVLSHDLRNPIQVAEGHIELAEEEDPAEHLDVISRMLGQANDLIEDILASIETNGPVIRGSGAVESVEKVELSEVATTSWESVSTDDATLEIDTDQTIRADHSNVQQLFENLFRNAVEHGGSNVRVTVGSLDNASGFYVADDGPGISEAKRSQVFEPGYTTADTGTGLGLHIVKNIVETHDWEVTITDSVTDGARFEISSVTTV